MRYSSEAWEAVSRNYIIFINCSLCWSTINIWNALVQILQQHSWRKLGLFFFQINMGHSNKYYGCSFKYCTLIDEYWSNWSLIFIKQLCLKTGVCSTYWHTITQVNTSNVDWLWEHDHGNIAVLVVDGNRCDPVVSKLWFFVVGITNHDQNLPSMIYFYSEFICWIC